MKYTVTIRFQYPAWDETNGITYEDVDALSKSDAVRFIRRMATDGGHIGTGGKGRVTITAVEQD